MPCLASVALRCVVLLCVALLCVVLLCVSLLCVSLLCFALRCFALRCVALRCFALRFIALRFVALRCFALFCLALPCFALRCVALRCFALLCVALAGEHGPALEGERSNPVLPEGCLKSGEFGAGLDSANSFVSQVKCSCISLGAVQKSVSISSAASHTFHFLWFCKRCQNPAGQIVSISGLSSSQSNAVQCSVVQCTLSRIDNYFIGANVIAVPRSTKP